MLARNAESLYWIGRYVERADDTARILDVTVHQLLEDSSVDPDQASRTLLNVLGIEAPENEALDLWSLTDLVAFSRDSHGGCSIVDSISAARENARGARKSRRPRSGSASTPPTMRSPSGNAPPSASGRTSSCPTSRGAPPSSPAWPTPRSPATTATASWCWDAPSNAST